VYDDDMHITRELLRAVAEGELPPRVLLQLAKDHLGRLCPHCREEMAAFHAPQEQPTPYDPTALEAPLASLPGDLAQSRRWIEELRPLSEEERVGKIERARTRFRGRLFHRLLLQEARASLPDQPAESHAWAHAAVAALFYARGEDELFALAIAYQANARRLLGDLTGAKEGFAWARRVIRQRGITDTEVYADIDSLQASLCIDVRAFGQAEHLLSRAVLLYRMLGLTEPTARVLMKLSNLYAYRGDLEDTLDATRKVLDLVDPQKQPQLYLYARFNLAHTLMELEEAPAARELMARDEALYAVHADECLRLRRLWLAGRVALALGNDRQAEERLLQAREGFARRSGGFDVACICLDLALLYHRQRRPEQVAEAASRAVILFAAREVHRDALAALVLVRDAASAGTLTAVTLEKVAAFLKQARSTPATRLDRAN